MAKIPHIAKIRCKGGYIIAYFVADGMAESQGFQHDGMLLVVCDGPPTNFHENWRLR